MSAANDCDWRQYRNTARRKPLLDAQHERGLIARAQDRDRDAVSELVDSHMRLVVQVASRYARQGLSAHDLVAEGVLGLLEAIGRFDLARDTRFASYAAWWVRACVRQHALENRRIVGMPSSRGARVASARLRGTERALTQQLGRKPSRTELAEAMNVSERDVEWAMSALSSRDVGISKGEPGVAFDLPDEHADPEEEFAHAETQAARSVDVKRAVEALSAREQVVIRKHVLEDESLSLSDVGKCLGVSRQRAGQILAGARDKLKAQLSCVAQLKGHVTSA